MWPHVQMRAVQGMRARRGVVDARVRSCHGVLGAYRSKERLSEHAGRDRVGVIVVRRLQGEAAIEGSPDFLQRYLFTCSSPCPLERVLYTIFVDHKLSDRVFLLYSAAQL